MGEKVYNHLSITGFVDEAARRVFRESAAKGSVAFSFERLLPLPEPEQIELEHGKLFTTGHSGQTAAERFSAIGRSATWGSAIYETEGDRESVNNSVEVFEVGGELGLEYRFDSHDDPPFEGIRHVSRMHPDLLFKLESEDSGPAHYFSLYKNGERFHASFFQEELIITRAREWPMIAALSCENWRDASLHAFLRDAVEKMPGDEHFEKDVEEKRERLRRELHEAVEQARGRLQRRAKNKQATDDPDVPF